MLLSGCLIRLKRRFKQLVGFIGDHGQVNGKGCPLVQAAVNGNRPFMLPDDGINQGKPQAGPFARFLSCEIGFKDPLHGFFIHAPATVTDPDPNILAVGQYPAGDRLLFIDSYLLQGHP